MIGPEVCVAYFVEIIERFMGISPSCKREDQMAH